MQNSLVVAGVLGLSLILSVSIYVFARLRIEQERTLQKLIERGLSGDELLRSAGLMDRGGRDLRRGLLLIGIGLSWSGFTFFVGGTAWMAGIFPVTIGAVYVLFRMLDAGSR
jgi:hypothetical protein